MANISIQVNTDGPVMQVSIDGQGIDNANDISVYTYRDKDGNVEHVSLSIYTTENMQNGVVKQVNYYASGTVEADAAIASGKKLDIETIPGFVGVGKADDNSKACKDIQSFFKGKRP